MNWVLEIKEKGLLSESQQPYYYLFQPPPPPLSSESSGGFSLNNKVSPSVLLIIIVLAIIFFISGLLHLLVRFLLRPPIRDPDDLQDGTALQGQLQQLFHLHDAGVDQSFIDTLPVFNYKAIIGAKDPFDCAVCLCEFEAEDKLRLLPKCSHAFHMDCIDTWLLSHSTCPLCRASLFPDFSMNPNCPPIVHVLESGSESSREILSDREVMRVNSHLSGRHDRDDFKPAHSDPDQNPCEIQIQVNDDEGKKVSVGSVVSVKLGKFKNLDNATSEGTSEPNGDARRCFSMGSFAYVMNGYSHLQVPISTTPLKKPLLPLPSGHRQALSECGFDSRTEFNDLQVFRILEIRGSDDKSIQGSKKESFSVSKIWLRPDGAAMESSPSRRAFSSRFPLHRSDEYKPKTRVGDGRTVSETGISRWKNGGELGCEDETQSRNSLDSEEKSPSFARKTLLWLMGRQNRVVHSSFSTNF